MLFPWAVCEELGEPSSAVCGAAAGAAGRVVFFPTWRSWGGRAGPSTFSSPGASGWRRVGRRGETAPVEAAGALASGRVPKSRLFS